MGSSFDFGNPTDPLGLGNKDNASFQDPLGLFGGHRDYRQDARFQNRSQNLGQRWNQQADPRMGQGGGWGTIKGNMGGPQQPPGQGMWGQQMSGALQGMQPQGPQQSPGQGMLGQLFGGGASVQPMPAQGGGASIMPMPAQPQGGATVLPMPAQGGGASIQPMPAQPIQNFGPGNMPQRPQPNWTQHQQGGGGLPGSMRPPQQAQPQQAQPQRGGYHNLISSLMGR